MFQIIDPSHFWAVKKTAESDQNIRQIYTAVNNASLLTPLEDKPEIGEIVVAPYWPSQDSSQPELYRAIVQNFVFSNNKEAVNLFYMDFGYTQNVPVHQLRKFKTDNPVMYIRQMVMECVLAHVKPASSRTIDGTWSSNAMEEFMDIIGEKNCSLYGLVYSIVNSVVFLTLNVRSPRVEEYVDVNKRLIKSGVADYSEEHYLSRQNHEIREQLASNTLILDAKQKLAIENMQYDQESQFTNYPNPPPQQDCHRTIHLGGPCSPLEMDLMHLVSVGYGKKIHVDKQSVNAVLLDTDLTDTKKRLIVASSVSQSKFGNNITIRDTTLMPNIPGLTALLCMIFCPNMELRTNSMKSHYTGALFGLGYHPETHKPLLPENDIEYALTWNFPTTIWPK